MGEGGCLFGVGSDLRLRCAVYLSGVGGMGVVMVACRLPVLVCKWCCECCEYCSLPTFAEYKRAKKKKEKSEVHRVINVPKSNFPAFQTMVEKGI